VSGCCPLVDGAGGGVGPPGPPGPPGSGGCSNSVRVEAADPFATLPAPVGGVITLLPDTYYVICGLVNIGPNRIEVPPTSVLAGKDPLVDSLTADPLPIRDLVSLPEGGTIRDLALVWPVRGSAIVFGSTSGPPALRCVAWNLSISGARDGIALYGTIGACTISRITCQGLDTAVLQPPSFEAPAAIRALYISEIASIGNPASSRQVRLQGRGESLACSALVFFDGAGSVGIDISGPWDTLQFWGCAYFAAGTPSQIIDASTGAVETTGTAVQSEAAAMVGYTNSTTRGEISVFQPGGGTATITPTGAYVPVGDGAPGHPLYTLGASSVRFALSGGPSTDTQTIEYIGLRPCVCTVAVSLSVALAGGFITTPRAIGARLLLNGAVLPDATWEGGFAPGAIGVTAGSIAFTTGITLQPGDQLQIEIANLGADPGNLVVTGAEVSIS